ncbi:MAG: VWA domain-containing protein [Candidatus Binatia bacterium]
MNRRWDTALCAIWLVLSSTTILAADASVLFVLDGSGSMWGKVGGKPKIEVARSVMGNLVNSLPENVSVGLGTYGRNRKDDCEDIEVLAPVGSDRTAIIKAVNDLNPKGSTPLTGAIRLAAAQLRETEGNASVVIVSDGKETCEGDPCAAVREAMLQGVQLQFHVIGFDVAPDEAEQLRCVAAAGKGKYFAAANAEELGTALAQVKEEVVAPTPKEPPPPPPADTSAIMQDDFERDELGDNYEIIDADPNRLAMDSGKLLVVATHPQKNVVLHKTTIPGNFIANAVVNMQVTERNHVGLYYWIDDKNYLYIGVDGTCCPHQRRPSFYKKISGKANTLSPPNQKEPKLGDRELKGYAEEPEIWHLQLERAGLKYTGRVSSDGTDWLEVGSHTVVQKNGRLGFGVNSGGKDENPAQFDDFVVKGPE